MKRNLFLIGALFLCLQCSAQYKLKQNNIWVFGSDAGLDFTTGTPSPILTNINLDLSTAPSGGANVEGSASLCDDSGHIMFYCTGDSVWDKNGLAMPNGGGLSAPYFASSATQGALIVPVLSNPNQYYIFTIQDFSFGGDDTAYCRLLYSIVDMTLNNGLGDIVSGQKAIELDSQLSEKMIAVRGNDCNIWLLVHNNSLSSVSNTFKAYEITNSGINTTPVTSVLGRNMGILGIDAGVMKISNDRTKLAYCEYSFANPGSELFDFDPATGLLSNVVDLDSNMTYGAAFSPDGSKLYCIGGGGISVLAQYDLSQSSASGIISSKTILDSALYDGDFITGDLRLGSDDKIYLPDDFNLDSISVINNPNAAGAACNFVPMSFPLLSGTAAGEGTGCLGNIFVLPQQDTTSATTNTNLLPNHTLVLHAPSGYFSYLWSNGTTDTNNTVTQPGTYWVTYSNYCTYHTDTFVVGFPTSVANVKQNAVTLAIYPSPAQTTVTITINGITKPKGTLQVIDETGRTVLEQPYTGERQTIDVSRMAAGIYMVAYHDDVSSLNMQQRFVVIK